MTRLVILLLCAGLVVAGCGSKKKEASREPIPSLLTPARTPDEWALRVVNRFLRPLNQDLVVLNNFNSPQIRSYIVTQNEQALRTINARLGDLKTCKLKLDIIGLPPAGQPALQRVNTKLRDACRSYQDVAERLLKATDLLSSGDAAKIAAGEQARVSAAPASRAAATALTAAIKTAQSLAPFRRAGLKPSV
jgi:hypothetical protein